jgi:hypothetical protein
LAIDNVGADAASHQRYERRAVQLQGNSFADRNRRTSEYASVGGELDAALLAGDA